MEFRPLNLDAVREIVGAIIRTTGPIHKGLEDNLMYFREDPAYPAILLQSIPNSSPEYQLVVSAEFKNSVKLFWTQHKEQGHDSAHGSTILVLLETLLCCDPRSFSFIAEGFGHIASVEYPAFWPNLAEELRAIASQDNPEAHWRVWKLANILTSRYPNEERSDDLYREINMTLAALHDQVLHQCRYYFEAVNNSEGPALLQYLRILKYLLRTFYNMCSQDLPAVVEENKANWITVVKSLIGIVIPAEKIINHEMAMAWFTVRGCAISSALQFATKYKEDFEADLNVFADEIWKILIETKPKGEESEHMIAQSLRFFKTFSESPNYIPFFSTNLSLMVSKVIFPNLQPNEETESYFEEEPVAFADMILSNREQGDTMDTIVTLLKSLARFQTDALEKLIVEMLGEYTPNMLQAINPKNEVFCLNIVCFSCMTAFNADNGATEINMHKELIEQTYVTLVKPRLGPIFKAVESKTDINTLPAEVFSPLLISYHLKFVSLFRNFLPASEVLDIAKYCSYLLASRSVGMQKVAMAVLRQLLNLRAVSIVDNMNVHRDESSHYAKYFLNPRKVMIKTEAAHYFNQENIFPTAEVILQNLFVYATNMEAYEASICHALNQILKCMGSRTSKYVEPLVNLFKILLEKMLKGSTYDGQRSLFDTIGRLLLKCEGNQDAAKILNTLLLEQLNQLMDSGNLELINFLLQIYAGMMKYIPGFPNATKTTLVDTLLSDKLREKTFVSVFPAYSVFFETLILLDPSFLESKSRQLQQLCAEIFNVGLDMYFFTVVSAVFVMLPPDVLKSTGWLPYMCHSAYVLSNQIPKELPHANTFRPLYFRELTMQICRFTLKHGFAAYSEALESTQRGATAALLSVPTIHYFIQHFTVRAPVRLLSLGLLKLLVDEFHIFRQLEAFSVWQGLFGSLLTNLYNRKCLKRGGLSRTGNNPMFNPFNRGAAQIQSSTLRQTSNNSEVTDTSSFSRLCVVEAPVDPIIQELTTGVGENDIGFCLDRIRNFIREVGQNIDFSFLTPEQKQVIDSN